MESKEFLEDFVVGYCSSDTPLGNETTVVLTTGNLQCAIAKLKGDTLGEKFTLVTVFKL